MIEDIYAELEASLNPSNLELAITGGVPSEGLLETKEGVLAAFGKGPIDYGVTSVEIAALEEKTKTLCVTDEKLVIAGHQRAKAIRIGIDAKRKEHKEVALQYGRRVDAGAKALTVLINPIEDRLFELRSQAEEIKAKAKREAEEAKRDLVNSRLSQLRDLEWSTNVMVVAEMTDEEFQAELEKAAEYFEVIRTKREAEAETKRITDELLADGLRRKLEQAELDRVELEDLRAARKADEERAKTLAAEVEAKQAAVREEDKRLQQEELQLQREQHEREQAILQQEFARQQAKENRIRAEIEAKAKLLQAEKDRLELRQWQNDEEDRLEKEAELRKEIESREAFERKERDAKAEATRQAYAEALKPDAEKINAFGKLLFAWYTKNLPICKTDEGKATVQNLDDALIAVCDMCIDFGKIRDEENHSETMISCQK